MEALTQSLIGKANLIVGQAGNVPQHGPVVDVHVQGAHLPAGPVEAGDQVFPGQAEGTGQPGQILVGVQARLLHVPGPLQPSPAGLPQVWEKMGPPHLPKLLAVFHDPFEAVVLGQVRSLFPGDVASLGQGLQGLQSGPQAQAFIRAPMDQLEHLDRELHIPQTALPQLDLQVLLLVGDQLLHPFPHGPAVEDEVLPGGGGPDQGAGLVDIAAAPVLVPSHEAGLQQGLEFPVLRPVAVIIQVGADGAHQGPGLPLGSQSAIDLPQRRFADRRKDILAGFLQAGAQGGPDGDHVGYVIDLLGPQLPHADDREGDFARPGDGFPAHLHGRLQGAIDQIGQAGGDGRLDPKRIGIADVGRGDGDDLFPVFVPEGPYPPGEAFLRLG